MPDQDRPICFVCGSRRSELGFRAQEGNPRAIHLCQDCGMAFVWPRAAAADDDVAPERPREAELERRLACLRRFVPRAGRVLELETRRGDLLARLGEEGWECRGTESRPAAHAWLARNRPELPVHGGGPAEEAFPGERFDAIVLCGVLRRAASPRAVLERLHDHAHERTLLFVEEASLDGLLEAPGALPGEVFPPTGGMFSRRSLFDVLERAGWGRPLHFGEEPPAEGGASVLVAVTGRAASARRANLAANRSLLAGYQSFVDGSSEGSCIGAGAPDGGTIVPQDRHVDC